MNKVVMKKSIYHIPMIKRMIIVFAVLIPCWMIIADTLYVPLPSLKGDYGEKKKAVIDLGFPLDSVKEVKIYWAGSITPGRGHGDGVEMPDSVWFDWDAQIYSYISPDTFGFWYAYVGPADGAFEDTSSFKKSICPDWNSLLDGKDTIEAELLPLIVMGGFMVEPPGGTIDTAVLILDVVKSSTYISGDQFKNHTSSALILYQNSPNPFTGFTTIPFEVASPNNVLLSIINMQGQIIETNRYAITSAGVYTIFWYSKNLPSGTYMYSIQSGNTLSTKKMFLLK